MKRNNKIQYSNTNRNTDWLTSPQLRPLGDSRTMLIGGSRKTLRDRNTVVWVCACVCGTVSNSSSLKLPVFLYPTSLSALDLTHMCKRQVKEYTLHTRQHTLTLSDVSSKVVLMFCPLTKSRYQGQSEKKTGGLSHNTVLSFLLRDARGTPPHLPP